jgi:hypothetical protein
MLKMGRARSSIAAWIVCAFIFLAACSTRAINLHIDPDFTKESIMDGGIAILGCTSIIEDKRSDFALSRRYSVVLQNALHKTHPELEIVSWGEVLKSLGDETLKQQLKTVSNYETLDTTCLDSLASVIADDSRYIVVYRIENKEYKRSSSEIKNEEEKLTGHRYKVTCIVTAIFSVYDFQKRNRVLVATIEGKEDSSCDISINEKEDLGEGIGGVLGTVLSVLDFFGNLLGGDEKEEIDPFPEPPSQESALMHIYDEFAKQLPI